MDWYDSQVPFTELVGKTLQSVEVNPQGRDSIVFATIDGSKYVMDHSQDCCESVTIEDIEGDLSDLIGYPITLAEEVESNDVQPGQEVGPFDDSFTWTFYRLATEKGFVVIRWYGESNGYYSEAVDFRKISEDK